MLGGWGEEFDDDKPVSEKDKKVEEAEHPLQGAEDLSGQHLSKSNNEDEVLEIITSEEMQG